MHAMPSVFVSHGSPTTAVMDTPAHRFLKGLGAALPRPSAILCVSAHWESAVPTVSTALEPETIHDFHGFPEALYQLRYPAPGAPDLALRTRELLAAAGFRCEVDADRGLDHGAWIPLILSYPEARVPVTQLSIQHHLGPRHHEAVGRALAPLRAEGVLVLCSGNITHNLRDALGRPRGGGGVEQATPAWASAFDDWVADRVEAGRLEDLGQYRALAPHGEMAHPRDEHFLPLFAAGGAGGGGPGRALHRGFEFGSLSMAAYAFGGV